MDVLLSRQPFQIGDNYWHLCARVIRGSAKTSLRMWVPGFISNTTRQAVLTLVNVLHNEQLPQCRAFVRKRLKTYQICLPKEVQRCPKQISTMQ